MNSVSIYDETWEMLEKASKETKKSITSIVNDAVEKFLAERKDVSIYQIRDVANVDYAFRSFNKDKFSMADYNESIQFDCLKDVSYQDMLEYIFSHYQDRDDMRSVSVSDVVRIRGKYYYCEPFGWKDITWFVR